jgi:cell division protein FtsW
MTATTVKAARARHPSATTAPRKGSTFGPLLALVAVLNVIGVVMVLSASSVTALKAYGSSWVIFERELMWVAFGAVALLAGIRIDYRTWRRLGLPLLLLTIGLLALVVVPGVGTNVYGSSRWFRLGPLSLQPSELAKLGLVLVVADVLTRRAERVGDTRAVLKPVLLMFGLVALLVMAQPDMGTTLVLAAIVLTLLFVGGVPGRTLAKVGAGAVASALLLARLEPYRWARMLSFRKPFADYHKNGYQLAQSLVGLGSGGLFGVGLGASRAKWGFLPNAYTDFIFAIIGEELGLLGALVVVLLFAAVAIFGVRTATRAPDRFGMLVASGVTVWIVAQAVINIGAVIGVLPITGVPLPFVSFGGSSLVITMAAVGVLLNIARRSA